MKQDKIIKSDLYNVLNDLEEKINLQKSWLDILRGYYSLSEDNLDIPLTLLIDEVDNCNHDLYMHLEETFKTLI